KDLEERAGEIRELDVRAAFHKHKLGTRLLVTTLDWLASQNRTPLYVGVQVTMADILAVKIRYVNTNTNATSDYFTFVVEDSDGGFLGTPKYEITIGQGCPPDVSGTEDEFEAAGILVYPNPVPASVGKQATIEFAKPVAGSVEISLLNLQGQRLLSQRFEGGFEKTSLATGGLPAGAYLLQVRTEAGVFVKKLVVE
ncbi:MAG: T9SS type A sorting domain-containing protein, partial [Bacteroidota bacterium]